MKNLLVHGIYLSVIAVLSFLLYDKTKTDDFVFLKSSEALASDSKILSYSSENVLRELKRFVQAIPKYQPYLSISQKIFEISDPLNLKIKGFTNQENVSSNEIKLLKTEVKEEYKNIISLISITRDSNELKKRNLLKLLLDDDKFWDKMTAISRQGFINQLEIIQNIRITDKLNILLYFQDKVTSNDIVFDGFRVAIAPQKATIFQGEKMKAEIYIAQFAKSSTNTAISANGKSLIANNGIAHFEEVPTNVGEHIISASITVKSPTTGETETVKGELKYEVLPKCSRDCAKNQ
jgi:hypothetical protein